MPARILILTKATDTPAEHVAERLRRRGADVAVFDPGRFPAEASLNVEVSPDGIPRRLLAAAGRTIDLEGLTAVWFRRPSEPAAHPEVTDALTRRYVERECAAFSCDVWDNLGCPAVPAADGITRAAAGKIRQLVEAGRAGFELPPTLITTDPDEFLDFYCAHDGKVITKVIEQLWAHSPDDTFFRYTQPLSTREVGYAAAVRLSPIIVQPYVEKAMELRVTVVGSQAFAAEIHSQESNHARLDWRRYDMRMTPHRVHELPEATADGCVRLVERLGLCYGAIDLIVTPDGRYVFLEINPNGEYRWVERATGLPITEAVCDLLIGQAQTAADRAPSMPGSR
jgi:glutathione synthase/RimK-type ligase-like ATP-grasp enzyme